MEILKRFKNSTLWVQKTPEGLAYNRSLNWDGKRYPPAGGWLRSQRAANARFVADLAELKEMGLVK